MGQVQEGFVRHQHGLTDRYVVRTFRSVTVWTDLVRVSFFTSPCRGPFPRRGAGGRAHAHGAGVRLSGSIDEKPLEQRGADRKHVRGSALSFLLRR